MRYEPDADPPVDFCWEREWRIQTDSLEFDPAIAGLALPNGTWLDRLVDAHHEQQEWRVYEYSFVVDRQLAEFYREPFEWRVFFLK